MTAIHKISLILGAFALSQILADISDVPQSAPNVPIPPDLSHLKPGQSLYFYYEPIPPKKQQQSHQTQQPSYHPQQLSHYQNRRQNDPHRRRVAHRHGGGFMDRLFNMFSFSPFWKSQISRQLEVVAASPMIAGAVVAGITALAGGLVYSTTLGSSPLVSNSVPISNNFQIEATTARVNAIVYAITPRPQATVYRPTTARTTTTTTTSPTMTTNPDSRTTAMPISLDGINGEEIEGSNALGSGSALDMEEGADSSNVVRLDSMEDEDSTTTMLPETTTKMLTLTMQKASSKYPDMILLPLTQAEESTQSPTTMMSVDDGEAETERPMVQGVQDNEIQDDDEQGSPDEDNQDEVQLVNDSDSQAAEDPKNELMESDDLEVEGPIADEGEKTDEDENVAEQDIEATTTEAPGEDQQVKETDDQYFEETQGQQVEAAEGPEVKEGENQDIKEGATQEEEEEGEETQEVIEGNDDQNTTNTEDQEVTEADEIEQQPERPQFGSSDQVISFIKQLTNTISKKEDEKSVQARAEVNATAVEGPSADSLNTSNIFDRISLTQEAKEQVDATDETQGIERAEKVEGIDASEVENETTTTESREENSPNTTPPPTNPRSQEGKDVYSQWTDWGVCSAVCTNTPARRNPYQVRTRDCESQECQTDDALLDATESRDCNQDICCESLIFPPDLEAPLLNRMTDAVDANGRPYSPKIIYGPEYDGVDFLNGLKSTFSPAISYPLRTPLTSDSNFTLMVWVHGGQEMNLSRTSMLPLISLVPLGYMDQGISLVLVDQDPKLGLILEHNSKILVEPSNPTVIPLDTWTNVAVTYNGQEGEVQFFLNGEEMGRPEVILKNPSIPKMEKLMLKPSSKSHLAIATFYEEVLPSEVLLAIYQSTKFQEKSKLFVSDMLRTV